MFFVLPSGCAAICARTPWCKEVLPHLCEVAWQRLAAKQSLPQKLNAGCPRHLDVHASSPIPIFLQYSNNCLFFLRCHLDKVFSYK